MKTDFNVWQDANDAERDIYTDEPDPTGGTNNEADTFYNSPVSVHPTKRSIPASVYFGVVAD